MAYTPELSTEYSGLLRRIAWAYNVTMTKALEGILELAATYMDGRKICESCKDCSFCEHCLFTHQSHTKGGLP